MNRTIATIATTVVTTAAALGAVHTATSPAGAVVRACVSHDGSLRVAVTCHKGERPLTWNRKGTSGPTGPQGERGPAGVVVTEGASRAAGSVPMSFSPGGNGSNWADGPGAFAHYTTGTQSTGFGVNTFNAATTGSNNTGLGYGAGRLTNGAGNTALGTAAMFDSTSGDSNVAVGVHAGRQNNGSSNVFVGADAQNGASQPSASVALGYSTTVSANNAVALGATARAEHAGSVALGQGAVTTATQQVMVGGRDVEITDATRGIILRSPNGTRFRVTVGNDGTLTTVAL